MNWKIVFILLSFPLLTAGCGSKENFIILIPAGDGQVGALEIETDKGSAVLDEEGKAIFVANRRSAPSEPTAIDLAEKQTLFQEAQRVHPPTPQRFVLYFKNDSEQLTEGSERFIATITEAIHKRESSDIEIIGYTDRTGEEGFNRILSMERAQVVYDLLRAKNIKADDMTILYYGAGNPLVPTADNVAESKNRRVEVVIR